VQLSLLSFDGRESLLLTEPLHRQVEVDNGVATEKEWRSCAVRRNPQWRAAQRQGPPPLPPRRGASVSGGRSLVLLKLPPSNLALLYLLLPDAAELDR
jgi:hypothetical protein